MPDATSPTHQRDGTPSFADDPTADTVTPLAAAFEVEAEVPDRDAASPSERSLRAAVRKDLREGLSWADGRVEAARGHIRQAPTRALAYGLGAGLLVGLMLRR